MKSELLFFVDFGLEHVSLLACKIKENRLIDISLFLNEDIKLSSKRPQDVFSQIENFEALLKIITEAEKKLRTSINEIIFTSKNDALNVYCLSYKMEFKKTQKILQSHKEKLLNKIIKSFYELNNDNKTILDVIVNNSIIDDTMEVKNPYKISCKKISMNASIIGIKKMFVNNLSAYLERYKLHIKHYISPCISVYSLLQEYLSPKENYLIIDIGACSTEYSIIQNECLVFLDTINLGGLDMTRDISGEMKIYIKDADISKKKISNESIKNTTNKNTQFVAKQIETIADARLFEIIENIKRTLQENKFYKKIKKVYIFGGVSNYKNAINIISEIFDVDTEIIDNKYLLNSSLLGNKIKTEEMNKKNIQLFGAVNFYMNNLNMHQNAKRGFLFKIPSKISCFLKDLLY